MEIDLPLPAGLGLKFGLVPPERNAYATAHLQGGGVLLDGSQSLTEEAVGFGVPVLKCGLQAIFPGAVALAVRQREGRQEITARYTLNLVEKISRSETGTVENSRLYAAKDFLAWVIRGAPLLRGALTAASSALRRIFGWETTYTEAGFSTELTVVSTLEEGTGTLVVTVEAGGLPANVTEVVVMNEQGAHAFDRYRDSSGACLEGKAIGCWDEVSAEEAWFESRARRVAFRLGRVDGARLFRGRELVGKRLAWAGFGYTFPPSLRSLRYELKIERAGMTSVLLIYPFFLPRRDRSVFRFPPLGVSYLAASLRRAGHAVQLLDCTFLDRNEALEIARAAQAEVVGIYCMVTMLEDCLRFARELRPACSLLVAGGPLATCDPEAFLEHFDAAVRGEGEQTMVELMAAYEAKSGLAGVAGIVTKTDAAWPARGKLVYAPERKFEQDLDRLPFPARELLPNDSYIRYGKKKYGYSITTVMSTRGCPFRCEFCSNVVFGGSYRERSPENVVDEIEAALALGYDRISFADDVFTMKRTRVLGICREIRRRGLDFRWECLGRVDALDEATAREMKAAGCTRIFFGVESGDAVMLELMNKKITTVEARRAVEAAHAAGLEVGAFFILCYPGDTDDTVLETLRFATSLPLDYLGLSMPYPLPGTELYKRVKDRIRRDWRPDESPFGSHVLIFDADFSEAKMWFGIVKGRAQFEIKKRMGRLAPPLLALFEKPTDAVFRLLK